MNRTVQQLAAYMGKPGPAVEAAWRQSKRQASREQKKGEYLLILRYTIRILHTPIPAAPDRLPSMVGDSFRIRLEKPVTATVEEVHPEFIRARIGEEVVLLPLFALLFMVTDE